MSYTYNPGTTTPNRGGLVEISGVIRLNDGTFELYGAPGLLWGAPGVADGITPLSNDHGGFAGKPLYPPREFSLVGMISVPVVDDLWGAIDQLFGAFNLADTSLKTLVLNTAGWSATRQIQARVAGDIRITEPADLNGHLALRRQFVIPMVAPDPRIYSTTLHTTAVTSGGTVLTNAGTMPTPIIVKFNSSQTAPLSVSVPSGDAIGFSEDVTSGYVTVNTRNAAGTSSTAVNSSGTSKYGKVTDWSLATLAPGATTVTATKAGGTGTTEVSYRDAWA